MKAFKNNHGKGFQITFPNGIMLSTQFGWGNYCENDDMKMPMAEEMAKTDWESNDAEIAIIGKKGEWLTREYDPENDDDVKGRVKIDDWLKAFDWCRSHE